MTDWHNEAGSANKQCDNSQPSEQKGESKKSVIAAVVGNVLIGIVKLIASVISGSSAMLTEGIHSFVDSGNGLLILFGIHRSKKKRDKEHPFGHGQELYFWTLVVAVLIFALGGGVSIMEGISAIKSVVPGQPMGDPTLSYVILAISAIIEGTSLAIALREFNKSRGEMSPARFIHYAKDPSLFTVVLEDSAAELGLIFAFLGIFFGHLLGNPYLDGAASVLIGCLLCSVSFILLRETKSLLIGEGLRPAECDRIRQIVESDECIIACGRILTLYIGPDDLLVNIDASFEPSLSSQDVMLSIDRIEARIHAEFPQTGSVFMEVESFRRTQAQRESMLEVAESDS